MMSWNQVLVSSHAVGRTGVWLHSLFWMALAYCVIRGQVGERQW